MFKSKKADDSLNFVAVAGLLQRLDSSESRIANLEHQYESTSESVIRGSRDALREVNRRQDEIEIQYCNSNGAVLNAKQIAQEHKIANLETKLNLLMGFLKIEEYEIPEVPPTPGIPARVDMRKVTGR